MITSRIRRGICTSGLLCVFSVALPMAASATQYDVSIDTSSIQGLGGALAFDFTSTDLANNTVTILNFAHNGSTGLPETAGGLVQGDIILLLNPAPLTTIEDDFFFNELVVPFTSFGTSVTFTLQITENQPSGGDFPDEFALFLLDLETRQLLFGTGDPLSAGALFAICVDGTSSGLLGVFDPTVFIPPQTLEITVPELVLFADGFESGDTSVWPGTNP